MGNGDLLGVVIGGCEVQGEIGAGGMGVIYRARQISLERPVALKVLAPRLAGDQQFVERFFREARAIARVNHPNILAVYDVGLDGAMAYMVMELVEGRSLSALLQEKGVLDVGEAIDYIRQAAQGLAAAFEAGILHRDIKPDNLLITRDGVVKVSDFGLAKEIDTAKTETDVVMGTPAYMSPEQCDGQKLDVRTDIYALGGTFYRLVTGRLPFESESAMSMMYKHKHEPLQPPMDIAAKVPRSISDLIVRMMGKEREARPGSMVEVVQLLDEAEGRMGETAPDSEKTQLENPALDKLRPRALAPARKARAAFEATDDPPRRAHETSVVKPPAKEAAPAVNAEDGAAPRPSARFRRATTDTGRIVKDPQTYVARGRELMGKGQFAEAVRCFQTVLETEIPNEAEVKKLLEEAEVKLQAKRKAANELRAFIQASRFDEVVALWDGLDNDLRESQMGRQVDHIKQVTLPAAKLCDQGQDTLARGALEEASGLFQKALQIEAECARAKQGLKEIQQRQNRITFLLKEGYEFMVKEEFDKAIRSWAPIFSLMPMHPQAVKYSIDAHLHAGHKARGQGDLETSIQHWKSALELQADHSEARTNREEDEGRCDAVKSLNEIAARASAEGKLPEAIRAWRQARSINPQNRTVQLSLDRACARQRAATVQRVIILSVALLVALAAFVVAEQWRYTRALEKAIQSKPEQAEPLEQAYERVQNARDFPGAFSGWLRKVFIPGIGMDPGPLEQETCGAWHLAQADAHARTAEAKRAEADGLWNQTVEARLSFTQPILDVAEREKVYCGAEQSSTLLEAVGGEYRDAEAACAMAEKEYGPSSAHLAEAQTRRAWMGYQARRVAADRTERQATTKFLLQEYPEADKGWAQAQAAYAGLRAYIRKNYTDLEARHEGDRNARKVKLDGLYDEVDTLEATVIHDVQAAAAAYAGGRWVESGGVVLRYPGHGHAVFRFLERALRARPASPADAPATMTPP